MNSQNKILGQEPPDKYQEFYDSSPVGFLTVDQNSLILESNLAAAAMLGIERNKLTGTFFTKYIAPDSIGTFRVNADHIFASGATQKCHLQLRKIDLSTINARLEGIPVKDVKGRIISCRITVIDLDEIKSKEIRESGPGIRITPEEFRKIFNAIPIPISLASLPDMKLIEINEKFLSTSGFTREEVVGLPALDINWKDLSRVKEDTREIMESGRTADIEMQLYSKTGELRTSLFSSEKIRLGERDYLLSASIDITRRKQAEEALKESESFNAALLNESPNPILVTNLDHAISYVNPALEQLTGYSAAELIGIKAPFPWWPPEKKEEYLLNSRIFSSAETIKQERYYLKKNGELFWAIIQVKLITYEGQLRYYVSNWVDITENKKNQEIIQQHELQLRSILDALTEGVALISPEGIIIQANKAEIKILGVKSMDEYIGQYFRNNRYKHKLADGSLLPKGESIVLSAAKRKRSIHNFELDVVRENGSDLWLNINAVPIIDDFGQVRSVVRTITDITEQKRLVDEREQFTRRLLEAQEEERKRISRDLHDDTAQYLALLKLEIDSIIDKESQEKQLSGETLGRLYKLRESSEKALSEVRRFSHELRPSVLEHFGLISALETIITEFKDTCKTDLRFQSTGLERRLPDDIELTLFRITQEAMSNIRKHSEASQALVNLTFSPQKVHLTISDNGKGFTPRAARPTGTKGGLGLIGMRERAHLIGAVLNVRSQLHKGTVISVELTRK